MEDLKIDILVLWSSKDEEKDHRDELISLEVFVNSIEFFNDPDECVNSIESIDRENIFVILGPGRCYLVDIFS
jgi:hypothetical protein